MSTVENLQAAFAGESQANRKYTAFAKKAASEGFPQVAKLFRAVAEAETVHALGHFRVMKGVGSTQENLKAAMTGEQYEFTQMYPGFVKTAEAEGNKAAVQTFGGAMAVEQTHFKLYTEALAAVQSGKDQPVQSLWVCSVCGHTHVGGAPDTCPVCKAKKEKFFEVK